MNLQEFIDKYNGKQVEVAGSANAKNQCVDLANAYIREVLGRPIIEWTDAKDFPAKAGSTYSYIKNTLEAIPQKGDIIVWTGAVGGGHGHIAICIEGKQTTFQSFDQNWSIKETCKIENHKYNNVDGWLRPKGVPMSDTTEIDQLKQRIIDLERDKKEQVDNLEGQVSGLKIDITNEQDAHKRDLQVLAEKLQTTDDVTEMGKAIDKLVVAEDGLVKCKDEKRKCGERADEISAEYYKTLEDLSLASGVSVASSAGVKRALAAYLKLHPQEIVGDIKDYKNIIKLLGIIIIRR